MKKDPELYRMNFLIQGKGTFTYKKMLMIFIWWFVFLTLLYGFQMARQYLVKRDMAITKKTIDMLNQEKDKQITVLQAVGRRRMGSSVRQDLTGILENRPKWSGVLNALSRSLPSQLWLESVSTELSAEGIYSLNLVGKAKSQRDITNFIMMMESKGLFSRTSLIKTKKSETAEGIFEFEMTTRPVLSKVK